LAPKPDMAAIAHDAKIDKLMRDVRNQFAIVRPI
jgi:hypothetical protein